MVDNSKSALDKTIPARLSKVGVLLPGSESMWSTPSDAPAGALEAVSSYVLSLVVKAGPSDTTPADEYQDAAAERFGQPFAGEERDAWFDKAIDDPQVSGGVGVFPVSALLVSAASKPTVGMQASGRQSLPELMSVKPPFEASIFADATSRSANKTTAEEKSKSARAQSLPPTSPQAAVIRDHQNQSRAETTAIPSHSLDDALQVQTVREFVSERVWKAGAGKAAPAAQYQAAAAEHFGIPLEGAQWDAWFHETVEAEAQRAVSAARLFAKADVTVTGSVKRDELLETLESESVLAASIGVSSASGLGIEEALADLGKEGVGDLVSESDFASAVRRAGVRGDGATDFDICSHSKPTKLALNLKSDVVVIVDTSGYWKFFNP